MTTVNFSVRKAPLYITLGPLGSQRRSVTTSGGPTSDLERFLGERMHGFTTLVRIGRGRGAIAGSFGRIDVEAGDVLVLPPGRISYEFSGERQVETLALPVATRTGAVIRARELSRDLSSLGDDDLLRALRDAPARRTFERTQAEQMSIEALAAIATDPPRARLGHIAHALGYTADGLRSLLQRTTGRGFAQWRDELTMARVRDLLEGDAPIVRIARDLAVESTYLHRRFARSHRTTPQRWRKAPTLPVHAGVHSWDGLVRRFGQEAQTGAADGMAAANSSLE